MLISTWELNSPKEDILRQIQDWAPRYAKGMMTEQEEQADRRICAERAVAKILSEERNDN